MKAFGEPISCKNADFPTSYKRIALAVAAGQASRDVNLFSSKRDRALAQDPEKKFPLTGFSAQARSQSVTN